MQQRLIMVLTVPLLSQSTHPRPLQPVVAATFASRLITSHQCVPTKTSNTQPLVHSRQQPPVDHQLSSRVIAAKPLPTPPSTAPYPNTATTASPPPTSPQTAPTSEPYYDSANGRKRKRAIDATSSAISSASARHCHTGEYGDKRARSEPWAVMCVAAWSTMRLNVRR